MSPCVDANFRHKAEIVLLDEDGEAVSEDWGHININDGGLLAASVKAVTASYKAELFSHFPGTRTINGIVRLWTYWAQSDTCCNVNNIPVENTFQVQLPSTGDYAPENGSVTATVIANGLSITNKYVQGKSGVRIKMAKPTPKLGATIKRMVVAYYDGVAYVENADSKGAYTFTLNRLTVYGSTKFSVYVEDSRGLFSEVREVSVDIAQYHPPELTECALYRADSNGTPNDYGEYGVISVTAAAAVVYNTNRITAIRAAILPYSTDMDWSQASELSLTPGEPKRFDGALDPTVIYRVRIHITDTVGETTVRYRTLKTAAYTLHLKAGGLGIGLGQAAKQDKTVALADDWDMTLYGGQRLLDILVPIGCIRMFRRTAGQAPIEPSELYPGTMWERVTNRFLLAASAPDVADQKYPAGSVGGSESFEILDENVPQLPVTHAYGGYAATSGTAAPPNDGFGFGGLRAGRNGTGSGQWGGYDYLSDTYANKGNTAPQPIRHLPPYVAVDVWIRIA